MVDFSREPTTYDTLGGLLMHGLQRIPRVSDSLEHGGNRFEVVSMDRHRIERVRARHIKV